MAVLLKHIKAVVDLLNGIEVDNKGTLEDILITKIAARHTRFIGAEVAIVFTAKLVWRKRDTNIYDATFTANTLSNESIPEWFYIGIVWKALLNKVAIDHTKFSLTGLIFVLLGKDTKAAIESLASIIRGWVHLDNIFKDKFSFGWVRHKRSGGDILDAILECGGHFTWKIGSISFATIFIVRMISIFL